MDVLREYGSEPKIDPQRQQPQTKAPPPRHTSHNTHGIKQSTATVAESAPFVFTGVVLILSAGWSWVSASSSRIDERRTFAGWMRLPLSRCLHDPQYRRISRRRGPQAEAALAGGGFYALSNVLTHRERNFIAPSYLFFVPYLRIGDPSSSPSLRKCCSATRKRTAPVWSHEQPLPLRLKGQSGINRIYAWQQLDNTDTLTDSFMD